MIKEKHFNWYQNHRELDDRWKDALDSRWDELKNDLNQCDRDWAKRSDLRDNWDREYNRALKAFRQTYDAVENGNAFALYQIRKRDDLDEFEALLDLDEPEDGEEQPEYIEELKKLGVHRENSY